MPEVKDIIMQQFSEFIRKEIGLNFTENRFAELRVKLADIAKERGFKNVPDFIDFIIHQKNDSRTIAQTLASRLTIGETYFWRDREVFRALEEELLLQIIERKRNTRKSIRIWSAGSSSGEEAYSIAILLQRLLPDIESWNITIIGTDINAEALQKAEKGIYTEWSFRSAPQWLKPNYFKQISEKTYKIDDSIKKMVKFSFLNLNKDPYPSLSNNTNGMDLIFCRNVFIYFAVDDILKISDSLYNCLVEKGLLITTATESFQYLSPRYRIVHYRGVTFYERNSEKKEEKKQPQNTVSEEIEISSIKSSAHRIKKKLKNIENVKAKKKVKTGKNTADKNTQQPSLKEIDELYEKGEYQVAEKMLEQLNNQSNHDSVLLQSRIKANLGKLDEAKDFCKKALAMDKINPVAYYLLSTVEAEKGNTEKAYKAAQKSFFLDSTFIINNYMLGNFARELGKIDESNKHFRNSLDLLKKMDSNSEVPESDGMTAARLENIISMILKTNVSA